MDAKTEAQIRASMTPEQIQLERKLTCEAIDGAIAFGYHDTNPPPSDDHWLAPFWKIGRKQAELEAAALPHSDAARAPVARALGEWHEDHGNVVWFTWQDGEWLGEPSYIGQPNDSDWPGYHTHWIPHPAFPAPARTHTTQPGESVAGIALRQCGNEAQWRHILECNPEFEDLLPNDYFPVGTVLMLPTIAAPVAPAAAAQAEAVRELTANDADMVWPDHDGETFYHTLDDAVEQEISNAWPIEAPVEFKFQIAKRIPAVTIRVTEITENGHEWEIVRAAPASSAGEKEQ
jgi:hypothetical protein